VDIAGSVCVRQLIRGFVSGAAILCSQQIQAASCCGGGSASSLLLPKFFTHMFGASFNYEQYHGFWNQDGIHVYDPPGSDLKQFRLNLGYAYRLAPNWQTSVVAPFVWNDNKYSGLESSTSGIV